MNTKCQFNPRILLTRPAHQAQELAQAIQKVGGQPILFPTLTITAAPDFRSLQQAIKRLPKTDIAIFTSVNAVNNAIPHIQRLCPIWPTHLKIAAIGQSTACALEKYQLHAEECPSEFSSEGLLALPYLTHVKGKTITIFKGLGGRELLANTLRQRGAIIHETVVYQRTMPVVNIMDYLPDWQANGIDGIISTSQESLENLVAMIGQHAAGWLYNLPLIVISKRMAICAQKLGFKQPSIVAENASNAALLAAFIDWRNKHA